MKVVDQTCDARVPPTSAGKSCHLMDKPSKSTALVFSLGEHCCGEFCASGSVQISHGCMLKHGQNCCRQLQPQLGQGGLHPPWPAFRSCPPTKAITTTSSSSTTVANAMAVHLAGSSWFWLRTPDGRPFTRSLWPLGELGQLHIVLPCLLPYQLPCRLIRFTWQTFHQVPLAPCSS